MGTPAQEVAGTLEKSDTGLPTGSFSSRGDKATSLTGVAEDILRLPSGGHPLDGVFLRGELQATERGGSVAHTAAVSSAYSGASGPDNKALEEQVFNLTKTVEQLARDQALLVQLLARQHTEETTAAAAAAGAGLSVAGMQVPNPVLAQQAAPAQQVQGVPQVMQVQWPSQQQAPVQPAHVPHPQPQQQWQQPQQQQWQPPHQAQPQGHPQQMQQGYVPLPGQAPQHWQQGPQQVPWMMGGAPGGQQQYTGTPMRI